MASVGNLLFAAESGQPFQLKQYHTRGCAVVLNITAVVMALKAQSLQPCVCSKCICHLPATLSLDGRLPSATFGYSVTDILAGSRKAVFVAAIL